jgi:hypothetical protein
MIVITEVTEKQDLKHEGLLLPLQFSLTELTAILLLSF